MLAIRVGRQCVTTTSEYLATTWRKDTREAVRMGENFNKSLNSDCIQEYTDLRSGNLNFVNFTPTFLEVSGIDPVRHGMQQPVSRSLDDFLKMEKKE